MSALTYTNSCLEQSRTITIPTNCLSPSARVPALRSPRHHRVSFPSLVLPPSVLLPHHHRHPLLMFAPSSHHLCPLLSIKSRILSPAHLYPSRVLAPAPSDDISRAPETSPGDAVVLGHRLYVGDIQIPVHRPAQRDLRHSVISQLKKNHLLKALGVYHRASCDHCLAGISSPS